MINLIVHQGPVDLSNFPKATKFGAYVLQSSRNPDLYRLGISGACDKGTLLKRLKLHASKMCPSNWTSANRPWQVIWALELKDSTGLRSNMPQCVQQVEHELYAAYNKVFPFLTVSGWQAHASDTQLVQALAMGAIPNIQKILLRY